MKVKFGSYSLDTTIPELRQNDEVLRIEPKVYDVLVYLIENRHRIVSKEDLINEVWDGRIVSDAAITSRINSVRQAVGDSGREQSIVQTIPKRGFRFVAEIDTLGDPLLAARNDDPGAIDRPVAASILVLPFTDLTKKDAGFLAQGLTEDLIVALSRYSDVAVISFQTALRLSERQSRLENPLTEVEADYLVSGTVRFAEDRVRVTAQLTEKATGVTIYSEKFDRRPDDIFELQDELVQSLAGRLPWRAIDAAGRKLVRERPPKLSSYQALLNLNYGASNQLDVVSYIQELRKILASDPDYAYLRAELAFHLAYGVFFTGQQEEAEVEEAVEHAKIAVRLAPDNERVLAKSAMVHQFAEQFSVAVRLSEQAMAINPHSTDCTHFHATILGASGNAEAALELHKTTQRLDPLFPQAHYEGMIEALYLLGRYDEALQIVDRWQSPARHILAYTGALAARSGDMQRATAAIDEFQLGQPAGYSNAKFISALMRYHKRPQDRAHWLQGFEEAKLPEMHAVRRMKLF